MVSFNGEGANVLEEPAHRGHGPCVSCDWRAPSLPVTLDAQPCLYPPRKFVLPVVGKDGVKPPEETLRCAEHVLACMDKGLWGSVVGGPISEESLHGRVESRPRGSRSRVDDVAPVNVDVARRCRRWREPNGGGRRGRGGARGESGGPHVPHKELALYHSRWEAVGPVGGMLSSSIGEC